MRIFSRSPQPPAPTTQTPTAEASVVTPTNRVNILIAEDSPTQARVLQKLLEDQGYRVELARDGQEALDYLTDLRKDQGTWAGFRPTLVVSDIVMPRMDGGELCRQLKADEDFKNIPVILLTSLTDAKEALRGLYNGADNLIAKPYEHSFLLARIEDTLATMNIDTSDPNKMFTLSMDGRKYSVSGERLRVINSVFTMYETAINQNIQLEEANRIIAQQKEELQEAQRIIAVQKVQLEDRL